MYRLREIEYDSTGRLAAVYPFTLADQATVRAYVNSRTAQAHRDGQTCIREYGSLLARRADGTTAVTLDWTDQPER